MPTYKLTYFNARGWAEVPRLLFAAAGVAYEDQRIEPSEWPGLKSKMPFGQLPVLQVDDTQIAQSNAIILFLAREFGFSGKTSLQQALVEMYVCALHDLIHPIIKIMACKNETEKEELKQKFINETAPMILPKLEEALVLTNSGYLVGDNLTLADVVLLDALPYIEATVPPEATAPFLKIKDQSARIASLPNIASWLSKRPKTEN